MFIKRYNIATIVMLIFVVIFSTQQKSFGYENNVRITNISINKETISIYSTGKFVIKQSKFKRNYKKFYILSFKNSILIGKTRVIYTPFPTILRLIITQFSIKPDTVHVVIKEAFFNPFFIKTFHIDRPLLHHHF